MENKAQKESTASQSPGTPLRVTQFLLVLNGLIWIGLAIYAIASISDEHAVLAWVILGFMFANGLILLWVAWGVGRGSHALYRLGLVQVGVNLILSMTDQIGAWDLIVLLLNAITLALLFAQRRHFGVKW
jgi:lysylphosphatidylglycerol synthetase-like protein (DUF2156 family)